MRPRSWKKWRNKCQDTLKIVEKDLLRRADFFDVLLFEGVRVSLPGQNYDFFPNLKALGNETLNSFARLVALVFLYLVGKDRNFVYSQAG